MIIKVDSKTINDRNNLTQSVANKLIGQILNLTLLRDGEEQEVRLVLGSRLAQKYVEASKYTNPDNVNFSVYQDAIQSRYITIEYPSRQSFPLYWVH